MLQAAATVFVLAIVAGGLSVWAVAFGRVSSGRPVLPAVPHEEPRWNTLVVLAVAIWIGWQALGRILEDLHPSGEIDLSSVQTLCVMNAVLVGLLLFLLSEGGRRRLAPFGVHLRRLRADLAVGGAASLASYPAVLAIALLTENLRTKERLHPFLKLLRENPSTATVVWAGVAVVVAAPLAEELIFRVVLQGALRSKLPAGPSIAISSVVFAGVHGFPDSLALVPLAVILGYVFETRRSYVAVVVTHALFNTTSLVLTLLSDGTT